MRLERRRGRGRFAPQITGLGLLALAALTGAYAVAAALMAEPWHGFALTTVAAGAVGAVLVRFGSTRTEPSRRETLIAVLALWAAVPLFGSIPYVVDGGMPWFDAVFESTSGFTATGATMLTDFGAFGNALFLYRAMSQWIGGIGIIVLFIAVFPQLAIAGRQLFAAELPGPSEERLTPRLRNTAGAVLLVYLGLSAAAFVAYLATGIGWLDSAAHAFTTVAAGGFSPEERSFAGLGAAAHWVAIVFMAFAGVNFALQYRALSGRPRVLARDPEFRAYLGIVAAAAAAAAWLLWPDHGTDAVRHGLFNVLSIVTTTGYASLDFGAWEPRQQAVLLLLMFVGGSAGSAAGGIKVIRLLVVAKHTAREVRRALHPRAVLPVRVGGRTVPEEVLRAVTAFLTLYLASFAALTTTLVLAGSDFVTAFTASIATLGNIGPGLGGVGPMESYAGFPNGIKALLTFAMYAGRLEVVAVFVLFTSDGWRLPRRRRSARS